MENINQELSERNLITEQQFKFLEAIRTEKIISLYFELRLILYVGIMLFTAGIGYIAYQNMTDFGHIICMILIGSAIISGFYFIIKHAKPYSNQEVVVNQIYFDYILVLVSLLIISEFAYIQVYFGLVQLLLRWTSFISAGILFFMAYRYDNRALLSMGITALAAAVGISITPIDWVQGDWTFTSNIYLTAIILGILLILAGQFEEKKEIKKHFRFTYVNFGLLLYFIGAVSAIFDSNYELLFGAITLVTAILIILYTWKMKEFLFFLYSSIAGYIALTYLIFEALEKVETDGDIYFFYFPITCIAYIVFLVTKKSHFAND
jgi:hypothetical protein